MDITLPYKFQPRPHQLEVMSAFDRYLFKRSEVDRFVDVVHRRGGKDKTWIQNSVKAAQIHKGNYFYILPTFKQAKKVIWTGIGSDGLRPIDHFPPHLVRKRNESDMSIELTNGSTWQLLGGDTVDGDAVVGTNPRGVVFSEWAIMNPSIWGKLRPILRENGGWAAFCYTPRGHNHGWDIYEIARQNSTRWFHRLLTIDQTVRGTFEKVRPGERIISKEDYEQEIKEGMEEDLARQEYYCSFEGSLHGAYYGKWMADAQAAGRIGIVPHDPRLPVYTSWDLGLDDQTSIWFIQVVAGHEFRCIDFYEAHDRGLDHYVQHLRSKAYTYATAFLPHDIEVRELGTGRARIDVLTDLGIRDYHVCKALPVKDGIDATRLMLPMMWFDKDKCAAGVNALRSYHREYDEKKKRFKDQPNHDWASHAADALRYFAVNFKEKTEPSRRLPGLRDGNRGSWMR